jgi:cellulose synthase/poly-beta-1,6-N-acetylglucosamine synthase-like glycosyltransferase
MQGWTVVLVLGCIAWLAIAVMSLRNLWAVRLFEAVRAPIPPQWPRLSVIVPACNEGATLEAASVSLRAQDYPDLEILLVDDRSTDDTGALVDRIAATDPRIMPLHIQHLPDGWLGKVHAMHVATQQATGDWLLYTDADVHHAPGTLRDAIAWAEAEKLDHLTLVPQFHSSTWWGEVGLASFGTVFLAVCRATELGKPGSDAVLGVGAFNLVRRKALEKTEGFEWLRLEIADDTGLAMLLHRHGAKTALGVSRSQLSIQWYASLPDMVHGLEKNMFAVIAQFSWLRAALAVPALVVNALTVPLALVIGPGWLRGLAGLAWLAMAALAVVSWRRVGFRLLPQLLLPVGQLLMAWVLLRSAWATLRQGGVRWRGTLYPLAQLREGQRVKL